MTILPVLLLGDDDSAIDDDLILDEINEIPEDYDEEEYLENTRFTKNIQFDQQKVKCIINKLYIIWKKRSMKRMENNINSDKLAVLRL